MADLDATVARIARVDAARIEDVQRRLDAKTKPRRSLGRLEEVACRVVAVWGDVPAGVEPAIVVVAADHGVAVEGVSAYPQEVTAQMVANFAGGGAAINVLARAAGARLVVVDAGVVAPVEASNVRTLRLGPGTANFTLGPAMPRDRAVAALEAGIELAEELVGEGAKLVALGEMGIANTTSASALTAALLDVDPAGVCGRGTGVDDEGLSRKVAVVRRGLAANAGATDPVGVLAALGGFEIAVLAGVALGCAAAAVPVVLDGFITGAAALVAARIAPAAVDAMLAAHLSPEPGHALVLDALGLRPLLDLGLRLGEGSGAALALPIVAASVAIVREMATFVDAGVTDAGR